MAVVDPTRRSGKAVLGAHQTAAVELLGVPAGLPTVDEELGGVRLEIEPDGQTATVAVVLAEALVTTHEPLLAFATRAGPTLRNVRNGGGTCTWADLRVIHGPILPAEWDIGARHRGQIPI